MNFGHNNAVKVCVACQQSQNKTKQGEHVSGQCLFVSTLQLASCHGDSRVGEVVVQGALTTVPDIQRQEVGKHRCKMLMATPRHRQNEMCKTREACLRAVTDTQRANASIVGFNGQRCIAHLVLTLKSVKLITIPNATAKITEYSGFVDHCSRLRKYNLAAVDVLLIFLFYKTGQDTISTNKYAHC